MTVPHLERANAAEVEISRLKTRTEEMSSLLLDIEGSLLAYWTDIPQGEIQRLLPLIREALAGDTE